MRKWIGRIIRAARHLGTLALLLVAPDDVLAGSSDIRRNLREAPGLVGLPFGADPRYRAAVDALTESAGRALPIPAESGAFTYRFDEASGEYVRTAETFGSVLFIERPQTVGKGAWRVGVSGQYLELDEFDGETVGRDRAPFQVGGDTIIFSATPKPLYHLATVNVTYGALDDLDVNLAVPLATVDFDVNATRLQGNGRFFINAKHGHIPIGIGDALLRAKYRLSDVDRFVTAAGFTVRLPTGDPAQALGSGDGELGPWFAASTVLWDRVEPQTNLGFDFNVDDIDRSSARYDLGVDVQAIEERLDLGVAFLGRSEVGSRLSASDTSGAAFGHPGPYMGMRFDRKDYFDVAVGGRVRLTKTLLLTVNVLKALNDDGLRSSNWSPVAALEATF
jgi:hypothetical protein